MDKKIEFKGDFTAKEIEEVLNKINDDIDDDIILMNNDFTLAITIIVTDEKIIVSRINNVLK